MGSRASLLLQDEEIEAIREETGCKYLPIDNTVL